MDWLRANLTIDTTMPSGLRWLITNRGRRQPMAGSQKPNGYWDVGVKGQGNYLAHRLVWALRYGRDPGNAQIDHRDRDKRNNHPSNLRLATVTQNAHNTDALPSNTTGVKGLTTVNGGYWQAQIVIAGVRHRKGFGKGEAGKALAIEWLDNLRTAHVGEFAN
jgi:hypothetical protein